MCIAVALHTRGCILGKSILKAGIQQLSGVTVVSGGIALQLPSGGSEHAGAQLLPFAACFFPVLSLWLYNPGSAFSEARAADVRWGAGGCMTLGASSINPFLSQCNFVPLKGVFLKPHRICLYFSPPLCFSPVWLGWFVPSYAHWYTTRNMFYFSSSITAEKAGRAPIRCRC